MAYRDQIIPAELRLEATRSGGPGGQHVNKSSTAIILRWNALASQSFTSEQKEYLLRRLSSYLTNSGDVVIRSEESRSQDANKKKCLEKLEKILEWAFYKPKRRKKTKPSKSSIQKNKEIKKKRSIQKNLRKKVKYE